MAYDLHELKLTGLEIKALLKVTLWNQPGEHGYLEIEADLGEEGKDYSIQEARDGQRVLLQGICGGQKETLFCGVITELHGKSVGNSYYVKMVARTFSYLLDIKRRSRSFQDISMTLGTLLNQIVGEYGGECRLMFPDRIIGEIAVQYNETDWEFMKRLLSVWNIPLAASEVSEGICFYAGVAEIPAKMKVESIEGVEKLLEEKAYWLQQGIQVKDDEFICYILRLNSRITLYSQVDYRNRSWIISKLTYETLGGRLCPLVVLRKRSGIREKSIFPMELVGSALEGEILQAKGEKVQIHLTIDDGGTGKDCYWFPFSTPSASSDGSGWYYMPQKGDKVRVYFPTEHTKEVVAISAVSTYEAPSRVKKKEQIGEK